MEFCQQITALPRNNIPKWKNQTGKLIISNFAFSIV